MSKEIKIAVDIKPDECVGPVGDDGKHQFLNEPYTIQLADVYVQEYGDDTKLMRTVIGCSSYRNGVCERAELVTSRKRPRRLVRPRCIYAGGRDPRIITSRSFKNLRAVVDSALSGSRISPWASRISDNSIIPRKQ